MQMYINSIHSHNAELQNLLNQVRRMGDQLVGPRPEKEGLGTCSAAVKQPYLQEIEEATTTMHNLTTQIREQVGRLEDMLGLNDVTGPAIKGSADAYR